MPTVIGFDPGLAKVGWAVGVVADRRLSISALGTWKTAKVKASPFYADQGYRALCIAMQADQLMEALRPSFVFSEEQGRMPQANVARGIHLVCGGLRLAAALREVEYAEITAQSVKSIVCADRKAEKEAVEADVLPYIEHGALSSFQAAHPRMKSKTKRGTRDHAFDACAVMVAGLSRLGLIAHEPAKAALQRVRSARRRAG